MIEKRFDALQSAYPCFVALKERMVKRWWLATEAYEMTQITCMLFVTISALLKRLRSAVSGLMLMKVT